MKQASNHGFTLVELAIVLVIIGLIIGGILTGKSLIQAAEVREVITNIQTLQTAYVRFKDKYRCLPGDCSHATKFFPDLLNGDGNGKIECGPPTCGGPIAEHVYALHEFRDSGLIPKAASGTLEYIPTKLRDCSLGVEYMNTSGFWPLYGKRSGNYGLVMKRLSAAPWTDDCMTSREAEAIDVKIDDGRPAMGKTLIRRHPNNVSMPYTECVDAPFNSGAQPNAQYTNSKEVACSLFTRMD